MSKDSEKLHPRDKLALFIKQTLLWLACITPIMELLKYNGRLKRCSLITSGGKKKNDRFILQIRKTRRAVFLTVTPFLVALVYHLNQYSKVKKEFSHLGMAKALFKGNFQYAAESLNSHPSVVISLATLLVAYVVMHTYLILLVKNYEVSSKTKDLVRIAKRLNIIEDGNEDQILWTRIGVLMQLKSSTAPELTKNTTFWNQLDMEPGEILYSKEEKKTFFVMSGFELADSYDFTIKD